MAQPPIIRYDAYIIQPGTDLALEGAGTQNLVARYGDYGGIGEAISLKANCSISISYSDIQWSYSDRNVLIVTGKITGAILTRTATGTPSTNRQELTAWFNDEQVFHTTIDTASSGTYDLNIPATFNVAIPPSDNPQEVYPAAIHFRNHNTGTTNPPDEFALGILITNPNPPDYRPGATNGTSLGWRSHDRSGGKAHILPPNSPSWREMRTIAGGTESGNPPSIYKDGKWVNQRLIGNLIS